MNALQEQLHFELQRFNVKNEEIETVFIGGGTPSTVAFTEYAPLFNTLEPYLKKDAEITSEANPNSATYQWLEGMKSLGVNRISFGVQSFNAQKLKKLVRAHSADQAIKAVNNAATIGYKNLSLDLIYATSDDTLALLQHDLDTALTLPINHISAYALTIEEGTPFAKTPEVASEQLEQTKWLFNAIKEKGFKQYEISNFGAYESVHNQGYWHYKDYIGLGAGAVGFKKDRRYYPTSNIEAYITNPLDIHEEALSADEIYSEKIFLGLRCNIGVSQSLLNTEDKKRADILVNEQKLRLNKARYFNEDYLLSDEIALFIMG